MNLLNSQYQKHYSPKRAKSNKKRLTQDQVRLLEASFDSNKKLEPERKFVLARELGILPRQIAIWYQNKRARWKNQSLELDYNMLQLRLESALAEKRQLERDIGVVRQELHKAQEMFFALSQAPPSVSSFPSCYEEGGSNSLQRYSLHGDVSCSWVNDEALQLEELSASCFMGAHGSNCV
ncbi:unnamed protein product [Ilex paraguariensis]|uniref:Homeobox-leucine zipper protein n=1 Tax=Ilex paraguariensis TaxID=185542 RepID=A0ABC8UPH7_9AQUA